MTLKHGLPGPPHQPWHRSRTSLSRSHGLKIQHRELPVMSCIEQSGRARRFISFHSSPEATLRRMSITTLTTILSGIVRWKNMVMRHLRAPISSSPINSGSGGDAPTPILVVCNGQTPDSLIKWGPITTSTLRMSLMDQSGTSLPGSVGITTVCWWCSKSKVSGPSPAPDKSPTALWIGDGLEPMP